MADSTPQRRPFTGSCHCGGIRYIVFIRLPHDPPENPRPGQLMYRCNCTICHKTGHLHLRVHSTPDDFLLLTPQDPFTEMGDYQCDSMFSHYFFCRKCAVRCFAFAGKSEYADVDLKALGIGEGTVKAWRPMKKDWREGRGEGGGYLSVNAHTLDRDQDGLDLREWYDKKWVYYLYHDKGLSSYDYPFPGGTF